MLFPTLNEQGRSRIVTETFRGYDHRAKILPGQWYDETNLTAAQYPLFSQRAKRGFIHNMTRPQGMLAKDTLLYVDDGVLYYGGYEPIKDVTLRLTDGEKQLVSMGAYAVIFPDKVYINTVDLSDYGSLDAVYRALSEHNVKLTMCNAVGEKYEDTYVSETEPAEKSNGMYWVDTSNELHVLKVWSEATKAWAEISTVYIRIESHGLGAEGVFNTGDGIELSGLEYNGDNEALRTQIEDLNAANIIVAQGEGYIVISGILDQVHSQTGGLVVKRECPDMDYVCESNNRIWGCKYGFVNGETVNEIYACKLGDPKNWRCYAGLSTDSYAVSVGTDGKFTGAITHLGYPLFFKENAVHKVYGSLPENFGVNTTICRGVQDGAWKSLNVVNEVLYYQSRTDICAYDGSLPVGVSAELGDMRYTGGTAGSDGAVYYISMQDAAGIWHMYTYDTDKRIWHREDGTHALQFANVRGDLMYIDADSGKLMRVHGKGGSADSLENPVRWSATSGIMGYENPYSQYLSRNSIRARLDVGARLTMAIEYDSDGDFHEQGTYTGGDTVTTINIPVVPRRCDHMRLKLTGVGNVKIYSIARYFEGGSDVWR